jgi:hypothetical protein
MTPTLTQPPSIAARPENGKVKVQVGSHTLLLSLRDTDILIKQMRGGMSKILHPTEAFRWEEPTPNYKESAVLICEDSRYTARCGSDAVPLPLRVRLGPSGVICGYVAQQTEPNGFVPQWHYIAAAGPTLLPVGTSGFADFEDAQAAVAGAIRILLGIQG